MKTICFILLACVLSLGAGAQTAKQILDKTAAVVGRKGGASANFTIASGKDVNTSGTVAIKGKKFFAATPEAKVWFDGKTQWTYMKSTNEVNVSNPTQSQQMSMNPYTFINIYKTGYNMTAKNIGAGYEVHLVAQNQKRTVQEMYITVSRTYQPTKVRMRQGKSWTNISISNFQAKNQSDATFRFPSKDFVTAEVIDLR